MTEPNERFPVRRIFFSLPFLLVLRQRILVHDISNIQAYASVSSVPSAVVVLGLGMAEAETTTSLMS
ncbi:MAG: hypothetical protein WA461_14655 [Nitrososphaeraceae archaeon]